MLKNLFKHEMRATAKTFIWLYIAFAVIAVVNAVFVQWGPVNASSIVSSSAADGMTAYTVEPVNSVPSPLQVILILLYMLAVAAISIGTLVVVILRFYRNLLGDEGYLMMTLPVSREKLILSKMLTAFIWTVCSGVLIFLSILLIVASTGHFGELIEGIGSLTAMGVPFGKWAFVIVLSMLVGSVSSILILYAAIAVGPNLLKNRLGGSILAFIIIAVASQIITYVIMIASASISNVFGLVNEAALPGTINESFPLVIMNSAINTISLSAIISSAAVAVACWFLTRYMLKRKLNLA